MVIPVTPTLIYHEGFDDPPPRMRTVQVWEGGYSPEMLQLSIWGGKIEGQREDLIALFERLLKVLDPDRQTIEEKLREACGGSEPSAGHDYADEVIGLLRVARSQRDDAWGER